MENDELIAVVAIVLAVVIVFGISMYAKDQNTAHKQQYQSLVTSIGDVKAANDGVDTRVTGLVTRIDSMEARVVILESAPKPNLTQPSAVNIQADGYCLFSPVYARDGHNMSNYLCDHFNTK